MVGDAEHGGRWKEQRPPSRAWKRRDGTKPTVEQDRAAGGRHRRMVDLGDGRVARGSITLRLPSRARRVRAALRWSQDGASPERYLGEVDHDTRFANLVEGWRLAHAAGLLVGDRLPEGSTASSPAVRSAMQGNKGRDTTVELRLRSLLHRQGLRFRVDVRPLSNERFRADILFTKCRVAVFVDGCFWHGCPAHHRPSKKNSEFWRRKIEGNRQRDERTTEVLKTAGWTVLRVWEHEDPELAAARVLAVVREQRTGNKAGHHKVAGPAGRG
ncbi:very short patch repair endonuclease [Streptomyces sp. DSM 42041]|uniref:Very short patch repair endonuclease n=1 Tax=Streptomyces hazeniae TaxID=3075538 RepID=A0ABU2NKE7_9ACTN|nr:very short patch repair endonuclease [Streptomyces sp. DSM 42041]MDT0377209.1 very short patch repair endonuclease [Streptomyces sp. DSM 42041]